MYDLSLIAFHFYHITFQINRIQSKEAIKYQQSHVMVATSPPSDQSLLALAFE